MRIGVLARLHDVTALVIPGVAHAGFVIDAIDRGGWRSELRSAIASGLPTLGICAGFHVLFASSDEAPQALGLEIFTGTVRRLTSAKVPHMGWNRVHALAPTFESGWAYFAHSFAPPPNLWDTAAVTEAPPPFTAVSAKRNVWGVQFHPERSGCYGARFLKRFLQTARETVYAR